VRFVIVGMNSMATFLLRENASKAGGAIEASLLATLPGLIEVSSFNQVLDREPAHDGSAIVLVVGPSGDSTYFERLLAVAEKGRNDIFLILISDDISGSDYKRLVRTGGADWVSTKTAAREIAEIIARRQQNASSAKQHSSSRLPPVTVSFVPSAGGVGDTTLITECAIYLKKDKATEDRKVCVVDLDFQTSHLCDHLDSEARLLIAEFVNAPERLDDHLLDSFKTPHASGVDVFAAPRSRFLSEQMTINALDALFSVIAKRYDLILIDLPPIWFSWTGQVIAACDGAVIIGLNTIPNLRQISETLTLVRASASALKIAVVLNRCEKNFFGTIVGRKQVERVLPDEELLFIASHPEAVESANMGLPMMLGSPARKIRHEFSKLANFCAELKPARQTAV
jgi:pilus assembly protein CpaE